MSHLAKCVQKCFINVDAGVTSVCVLNSIGDDTVAEVRSAMNELNLNVWIHFFTCCTLSFFSAVSWVTSSRQCQCFFMPPPNVVSLEAYCCLSCSSVRAFRNIVNTISCRVFDTFSPTYLHDVLWDTDERVTIWGQKAKGQGGIKYAGNSTFWSC